MRRFPMEEEKIHHLIIATWCDPRFSNFSFVADQSTRESYKKVCLNAFKKMQLQSRGILVDDLDDFLFHPEQNTQAEFEYYNEKKMEGKTLTEWWSRNQTQFPNIGRIERNFLAIPASSATSERVFSKSNRILSKLRSRLSDNKAKILTFISVNRAFQDDGQVLEELDWVEEL